MKRRIIILTAMVAMAVSCDQMSNKYGRGGDNACQYVKEQVPGLREDIASVEVIEEDSLLSDIGLIFGRTILAKSSAEFQEGTLSKDKFKAIIDSLAHDATDVEYSWRFSNVINDSLRALQRYSGQWRKVYTVRVTMKSGTTKEPRVMMDNDGITPRMIERDMENTIRDFTNKILDAQELLWVY